MEIRDELGVVPVGIVLFKYCLRGRHYLLFYAGTGTSASGSNRREMGEYLHTAAVCCLEPLDNFSLIQWLDADMHVKAE